MSVIAMTVIHTQPHPNADTLRIYELQAGHRQVTIIANDEHVYHVGERAIAASVGTELLDGTTIRRARLRGIDSFGMLLGKTDVPEGTDLSKQYARPTLEVSPSARMIPWASIELLHNVRRTLLATRDALDPESSLPRITYRAKVKLDGTHAGIQVTPNGLVAQSRSRVLTPTDDNYGFAAWLQQAGLSFEKLQDRHPHTVVYGEWCGPGIQKRTAITAIDRPIFVVFAIQVVDQAHDRSSLIVDPDDIRALLPEHRDLFVLPWHGDPFVLDFEDPTRLETTTHTLNEAVHLVERRDPWVYDVFGVDGMGEGVVLYPIDHFAHRDDGTLDRDDYVPLLFKAKGEKHQVVRQKQPVQIDPEVAQSIEGFADLFVTPTRMEQAVQEGCQGRLDMRHMGAFLKWLNQDIQKESQAELEASGLTWAQVHRAVSARARTWYKDACMRM